MDRRSFFKTTAAGAAAVALASGPASLLASCTPKPRKPNVSLNISFQTGIAVGESYAEKFDYMESLGVVGYEPGGQELVRRYDEIAKALEGRNLKVSAICAGFRGFILAEDPAVKADFDSSMREIIDAAGQIGSTGVIMVPAFNHQKPCMPHTIETRDYLCAQLHELGEYALKKGTAVILEPLNRGEAFYMRLVADAAAICRDSESEGVKCMGDFWHMKEETSDYAALMAAGKKYLRHVHIASRGRRVTPGEDGEKDNYIEGFRAMKELEFPYYMSFECGCAGDRKEANAAALELLRNQWEQA
ncbi:MAG: sugar phosphate isomerase/epimerase [Bacteroidales bacterium]|nr:sugar phosphate isomerase/epimerase [Bacteroidales bacterium]MBO7584313.1 sugar phosphate isomerase/epimerase [Bacteroidales bacterium]MBP5316261.1 sugar phosphate isomerase/epimerase [Bacteroidales bacterium]